MLLTLYFKLINRFLIKRGVLKLLYILIKFTVQDYADYVKHYVKHYAFFSFTVVTERQNHF